MAATIRTSSQVSRISIMLEMPRAPVNDQYSRAISRTGTVVAGRASTRPKSLRRARATTAAAIATAGTIGVLQASTTPQSGACSSTATSTSTGRASGRNTCCVST